MKKIKKSAVIFFLLFITPALLFPGSLLSPSSNSKNTNPTSREILPPQYPSHSDPLRFRL